jgi:putative transcriptional regulator
MTYRKDPSEERLLAYAAGTLSPPESVVVAAHLAMRPRTEAFVRALQVVGGEVLEDQSPAPMAADALDRALARAEVDGGEADAAPPLNDMPELPEPLRRYSLGRWRTVGPDIQVRAVHAPTDGKTRVILLKIGAGRSAPLHTHGGVELTCVLTGRYVTDEGEFGPGDFEEADHTILHRPRVESDEPCLCVAALDGQIKLHGLLGKLIQPFVRL